MFFLMMGLVGLMAGDMTFDQGLAQAKAENKPLLVDFYAVWCGPCKAFDRDSKSDEGIKKLLEQVVLVKVDAEKGEGVKLAEKYNVDGYPTYYVFSGSGDPISAWVGYSKDWFSANFEMTMEDTRPLHEKEAAFEKEPNQDLAARIGRAYKVLGESDKAYSYLHKSFKMGGDTASDLFHLALDRAEDEGQEQWEQAKEIAQHLFEHAETEEEGFNSMLQLADFSAKNDSFRKHTKGILASLEAAASKYADGLNDRTKAIYLGNKSLFVDNNSQAIVDHAVVRWGDEWEKDGVKLNEVAWFMYERQAGLDLAMQLAQKSVKVLDEGPDRAAAWDTLGCVQFSLGQLDDAISSMEKAVKEDPDQDYYQKQLDKFKTKAKAMSGSK